MLLICVSFLIKIQCVSRKGFGILRISCLWSYTLSIYPSVHKQLLRSIPNPFRGTHCVWKKYKVLNYLGVWLVILNPFYFSRGICPSSLVSILSGTVHKQIEEKIQNINTALFKKVYRNIFQGKRRRLVFKTGVIMYI